MPKQTQTTTTQTTARTNTPARPAPTRTSAEALVQRAMADPATLTAQDVVQLQRHLGNNATNSLLTRAPSSTSAPANQRALAEPASAAPAAPWQKSYYLGRSLTKLGGPGVQRAPWVRATPTALRPENQSSPTESVESPGVDLASSSESQASPRAWVSATPTALRPQGDVSSGENVTPTTSESSPERPTTVTDQVPESGSDEQTTTEDQSGPSRPLTSAPTTPPTTTAPLGAPPRPSAAAPVVPVYPGLLTEAQWRASLSVMAKLGRDDIGTQLKILDAAHRGTVWNRFDITKLPPGHTVAAEQSLAAATESTAAVETAQTAQAAAKAATEEAAKLTTARAASEAISKAKGALDTTRTKSKAAIEEAELLLGEAKAEFKRSIITLLGRLQMLSDSLREKQAQSPSVPITNMLPVVNQYRNQLMALTDTYKAFEQARDAAKARADAAEQAISELEASATDEYGLPLNPGVTDWEADTDEDGNPMPKPVKAYLGGKFYGDLKKLKFPLNREVQAWFTAEDATVSAKTDQPDQPNLARLQDAGQEAAEDFIDLSKELVDLGNDVLPREEGMDKVNDLWKKAHAAFGDETKGGVFGSHKQWTRQQITLAGGQNQFDAWKLKFKNVVEKHSKAGAVLKSDMTTIKGLQSEVTQASH